MRSSTQGFSIIEVLVAAVIILVTISAFAVFNTQTARSVSTAQLATYTADALTAASLAITQGNATYLHSRELTAADLQDLTSNGTRRTALRPALSGTITAQGSDPPRYLVTIRGPDFALSNIVTAPGGNP